VIIVCAITVFNCNQFGGKHCSYPGERLLVQPRRLHGLLARDSQGNGTRLHIHAPMGCNYMQMVKVEREDVAGTELASAGAREVIWS
jgi:hypothetical protein